MCEYTVPDDTMMATKSALTKKEFKKRVNQLVSTRDQCEESREMSHVKNYAPKLLKLAESELTTDNELDALRANFQSGGRKRKKPSANQEVIDLDGVAVDTSTLAPTTLKGKVQKKHKAVAHRGAKPCPPTAPDTPVVAGEENLGAREEEYPLQTSQPIAPKTDVRERAEPEQGGPSNVPEAETMPTFEEQYKVKQESCFDERGYIHPWAKKYFARAPFIRPWPKGGLIVRNNYVFSSRTVLQDGLYHVGITFAKYAKEFSENLAGLQRMSQQPAENINVEVFWKLAIKNEEVKSLLGILNDKDSKLAAVQQQLKDIATSLAKAKQIAEDSGNTENLQKENSELYKMTVKLQKELEATQRAVELAESRATSQAEKDAVTIRDLENSLNQRLEEGIAMETIIEGNPLAYPDR